MYTNAFLPSTLIWNRGAPPPQLAAVNLKSVPRFWTWPNVMPAGTLKSIPPKPDPTDRSWIAVCEWNPGWTRVASPKSVNGPAADAGKAPARIASDTIARTPRSLRVIFKPLKWKQPESWVSLSRSSVSTMLRQRVPWWQQPPLIWTLGMITVLLIAISVEVVVGALRFGSEQRAYDATPLCSSTADIAKCRFQGPARIVTRWRDKHGAPNVEVAFVQLGGLKADAALDGSPPEWERWQPEDQVPAELWHGKLTLVDGARTLANPDVFVGNFIPAAYIIPPIALALLAVFAFWGRAYRHATSDVTAPAQSAAR